MKKLKIIISCIILLLCSNVIISQNKWSVEFRPAIDFPSEDLENSNIKTGFGFEVRATYLFMEHLSAYAGWGFNTFEIEDFNYDLDETGYVFGLQFNHPLGASERLYYILRVGATYNHLELENTEGDLLDDSGHGLGWQIGAGLGYNLGDNWDLRPTVRFSSLSRDLEIDNENINVDLNYLSFGIGITKTF